MPDAEKGGMPAQAMDPSTEAAAAKLWAVYVSEAEKYDKSLVESWKSDMEGMLIFAGLFSASLTAFIIESYKTLIPDSGDSTVQLLAQISQQLSAAANGSHFQIPEPTHFTPPTSSVVCNALWFISLGLSLTCALIATLLEQWARDFLHRADMRSSPVTRARIFSYLYYGLKRFGMHTVVDIIPLFLHASLFFFFGGLVAFLLPINLQIAVVATTILVIVVVVYILLTLLPLVHLDCPYRTPLSAVCWRISEMAISVWYRCHSVGDNAANIQLSNGSIIEAMSNQAVAESRARSARDYRALVWTVKSLSDDVELEPFVEGLPDILWGPDSRRYRYDDHIQRLIRHPDLQFQSRLENLLYSCDSGLLSSEATKRRRITCCKALWAIASVQPPAESPELLEFLDFSKLIHQMEFHHSEASDVLHYHVSALVLVRWSTFCSVKSRLNTMAHYLAECNMEVQRDVAKDLHALKWYLNFSQFAFPVVSPNALAEPFCPMQFGEQLINGVVSYAPFVSQIIPELRRAISEFNVQTPYRILFQYIRDSSKLGSEPYRFHETRKLISLLEAPFSALDNTLAQALTDAAYLHFEDLEAVNNGWYDTRVLVLCSFWQPNEPVPIPYGILYYLVNCSSDEALDTLLVSIPISILWSYFPITLSRGPSGRPSLSGPDAPDPNFVVNTALWRLASSSPDTLSPARAEPILEALQTVTMHSPVAFSAITMLKSIFLGSLRYCYSSSSRAQISPLRHPLLATETAIPTPSIFLDVDVEEGPETSDPFYQVFHQVLRHRIVETKIALIADFLNEFRSEFMPYKAKDTLRRICRDVSVPLAEVHATHQVRFAQGIHHILVILGRDNSSSAELLDAIFNSQMFEGYFDAGQEPPEGLSSSNFSSDPRAWLEESSARVRIQDTLIEFYSSSEMPTRIRVIFDGLQYLHTDREK